VKKNVKKLKLHRETLHSLQYVTGGVLTGGEPSSPLLCRPVYTVDDCGSNLIACASDPNGCGSGLSCIQWCY
jgi:hypothetical protein